MRVITPLQAVLFSCLLTLGLVLAVVTGSLALGLVPLGDFRGVTTLIVVVVFVYLFALILFRALLWLFPLRDSDIGEGSREEFIYHLYLLFNLVLFHPLTRSLFLPVPLMRLVYLAMGAHLGRNTYSAGTILDPILTHVGNNSIIGHDAVLFSHIVEGRRLALASIRIGHNVTIGAKAVIMPGVTIDDGAIVAVAAVVGKGTHIAAGELWGGIPARRLRGADE
jgi:acetyltransferase-like isoleucine patch superfamily enzyme